MSYWHYRIASGELMKNKSINAVPYVEISFVLQHKYVTLIIISSLVNARNLVMDINHIVRTL